MKKTINAFLLFSFIININAHISGETEPQQNSQNTPPQQNTTTNTSNTSTTTSNSTKTATISVQQAQTAANSLISELESKTNNQSIKSKLNNAKQQVSSATTFKQVDSALEQALKSSSSDLKNSSSLEVHKKINNHRIQMIQQTIFQNPQAMQQNPMLMQQIMMLQQKNNSAKTADSLTPITEEISILANQAGAPLRGNSTNPYYSQQNQFSSYNQQITKQAPSGFFNTPISVTSQQQLFQLITQASTYEAQALIFYNYRNADQYNQNLFQQAIQQLSQYKILAIYANTQSDAGLQSFVATLGFGDPGGTGDYSGSTPAAYYHPGIITCKFNNTIQQNQQATQYNITQFLSNPQLACNSTMINGNNVSAIQNAIQQFISSNNIMPSINTNFAYSGQQNMLYQPQQTSQQNMLYQAPMMNQNYNNSFSRNTTSNPFYTNKNPSVKGMITTPGFMPI